MNRSIFGIIIILLSAAYAHAEPGATYTLTGKEKSIQEIVETDMKEHPELYRGEQLNFYVLKFKKENDVGKRKLAPGDELTFPETTASRKADKEHIQTNLVGKWMKKSSSNPEKETVTEYRDDGTVTITFSHAQFKFEGHWELVDGFIKVKVKPLGLDGSPLPIKVGKFSFADSEVIDISESVLRTRTKGQEETHKRIK